MLIMESDYFPDFILPSSSRRYLRLNTEQTQVFMAGVILNPLVSPRSDGFPEHIQR